MKTLLGLAVIGFFTSLGQSSIRAAETNFPVNIEASIRTIAAGPFQPTWASLEQNYKLPDWYRDAKFGIWAHWGPQCQPQQGDWYAQRVYVQDHAQNKFHVEHYGPPSQFGFKDVIHEWKADKWNPEELFKRYQRAGAKFFVAMANHHDNFDMYDSKFQPWNSVNVGPKQDIVGTWAKLAHKAGMPFGVSVHSARAWSWYEVAQGADTNGPLAGVPYDGKLTKADGNGLWWDGLDPQDLYAQNHKPGAPPDAAYVTKWFNRTQDLLDKYHPDLLYFDDARLPLGDAGLNIAAHFFNANKQWHGGKLEAVITSKELSSDEQKAVVNDLERNLTEDLLQTPWQKDLCIGAWHYDENRYKSGYRSARSMVNLLVDVVSKNGTFLLNIPLRGDGGIDDKAIAFLDDFTKWMDVNSECIYGTRPWKIYGEGPSVKNDATAQVNPRNAPRGIGPEHDAKDIRFTKKGETIYAIALGWPTNGVSIKSLGNSAKLFDQPIRKIELLGSHEAIQWTQTDEGLIIRQPENRPGDLAIVFKITP